MEQIVDRIMKGMLRTTEERAQGVVSTSTHGSLPHAMRQALGRAAPGAIFLSPGDCDGAA